MANVFDQFDKREKKAQENVFDQFDQPMYTAGEKPSGMVSPGNIDLSARPRVPNGSDYSTVLSMGINVDGKEVLIPRVSDDGRILSEQEAIQQFRQTGKNLGAFDSVESANAYAQQLHQQQAQMYGGTQQSPQQFYDQYLKAAEPAISQQPIHPTNEGDSSFTAGVKALQNVPDIWQEQIGGVAQQFGERKARRTQETIANLQDLIGLKGAEDETARQQYIGTIQAMQPLLPELVSEYGPEFQKAWREQDWIGALDIVRSKPMQPSEQDQALAQWGQQYSEAARQERAANQPNVEPGSLPYYVQQTIESGLGTMAPALGMTLATGGRTLPGLATMFAQVMGQSYSEARQSGYNETTSQKKALFDALTEAGSEEIPLGILTKEGGKLTTRILKGMSAEAIQEVANEAVQIGYQTGVLNENVPGDQIWQRLVDAGIIGGAIGAGGAVIAHPFTREPKQEQPSATTPGDYPYEPPDDLPPLTPEGGPEGQGPVPEPFAPEPTAKPGAYDLLKEQPTEQPAAPTEQATTTEGMTREEGQMAQEAIDQTPGFTLPSAPQAQQFVPPAGPQVGVVAQEQAAPAPSPYEQAGGYQLPEIPQNPAMAMAFQQAEEQRNAQAVRGDQGQALQGMPQQVEEQQRGVPQEMLRQGAGERGANLQQPPSEQPGYGAQREAKQQIEQEAQKVAKPRSEREAEAGVYRKGHVKLHGLDISIETPKGDTREGTDKLTGKRFKRELPAHYGYIRRTQGADGEQLDVFLGPKAHKAGPVYVIDQKNPETGAFDEHKAVMGVSSPKAARQLYESAYSKGWKGFGAVTKMDLEDFKHWVRKGKADQPLKYQPPSTERAAAQAAPSGEPRAEMAPSMETELVRRNYAMQGAEKISRDMAAEIQAERVQASEMRRRHNRKLAPREPEDNDLLAPKPDEQRQIAETLGWLRQQKLPDAIPDSINGFYTIKDDPLSEAPYASINLGNRTINVNAGVFDMADPYLHALNIAHELGHAVDMMEPARSAADAYRNKSAVTHSPLFKFDLSRTHFDPVTHEWGFEESAAGPVFKELIDVYQQNRGGMQEYFSYPFGRMMSIVAAHEDAQTRFEGDDWELHKALANLQMHVHFLQTEAFAQAHSLYYVNPELLRANAPQTYEVLEEIHNAIVQGDTLADSRDAVRAALQSRGSDRRYPATLGEAIGPENQLGTGEGQAGARVESAPAEPERARREPYQDYVDRAAQVVTWEALPSTSTQEGQRLAGLSAQRKADYTTEAREILRDPDGVDGLARRLGILPPPTEGGGTGGYEGAITPNVITGIEALMTDQGLSREQADAYAKGLQYVYTQDAVPWFRPDANADTSAPENAMGARLRFPDALSPEQESRFFDQLREALGEDAGYTKITPTDVVVVNFRGEDGAPFLMDDESFHSAVEKFGGEIGAETEWFGAQGNYIAHDWQADPEGLEILRELDESGRPALSPWLRARREQAQALARRYAEEPRFAREPGVLGGLSAEDARARVREISAKWSNAPPIEVVQQETELPEEIASYIQSEHAHGTVAGVYHNGKVHIVADHIFSPQHLEAVVFEEALGHYGLRGLLGEQLDPFLDQVYQRYGRAGMRDVIERYFTGEQFDAEGKRKAGPRFDPKNPEHRRRVAEEKLTDMAQTGEKPALLRRLYGMIRDWLRRMGFNLQLNDADIQGVLQRARWFVERGRTVNVPVGMAAMWNRGEPHIFYSQMRRVLDEKLPGAGTPKQFQQAIEAFARKGEFKREELEWSGLMEALEDGETGITPDAKGKITKEQVSDYVARNQMFVKEVLHDTGESFGPRYETYTLPGGENYRELLITMPLTRRGDVLPSEEVKTKYQEEVDSQNERYHRLGVRMDELRQIIATAPIHSQEYKDAYREANGLAEERRRIFKQQNKMYDQMIEETIQAMPQWQLRKPFGSPHWNEYNVLAHVRFKDRKGPYGGRMLFVEEIQSDIHQQARQEGFRGAEEEIAQARDEMRAAHTEVMNRVDTLADQYMIDPGWVREASYGRNARSVELLAEKGVPEDEIADLQRLQRERGDAIRRHSRLQDGIQRVPFVGTWHMLALKRMIRWATEGGYDSIGWTTGIQQADRYNVAGYFTSVTYDPNTRHLIAYPRSGEQAAVRETVDAAQLDEYLGADIAEELRQKMQDADGEVSIDLNEPRPLKGHEGMFLFYDRILPKDVEKYVKKWGAEVKQKELSIPPKNYELRNLTYEGPSYTAEELRQKYSEMLNNPMLSRDNVALGDVLTDMGGGRTFRDAMMRYATPELAEILGGKLYEPLHTEAVWTLPVTDQMRQAAMNGQPMFNRLGPRKTGDQDLDSLLGKIGSQHQSLFERVRAKILPDWKAQTRTYALDRFYGLLRAERQYGEGKTPETSAYVAHRMSTSPDVQMLVALSKGPLVWENNRATFKKNAKGLLDILQPVADKIDLWEAYAVAVRAERLKREGREHLFTDAEIKRGIALGRQHPEFEHVRREWREFNRAMLDFAEEAGLINADDRAMWEHDDYVPFYRIIEERAGGPRAGKGTAGQTSGVRRLRGGEQNVNDILANMLQNTAHLIEASMKNHAARMAVENLEQYGVMSPAPYEFHGELIPMNQLKTILRNEYGVDPRGLPTEFFDGMRKLFAMHAPKGEDVIRVMIDGKPKYYTVYDRLVLRAMTELHPAQWNDWWRTFLRKPAHWLRVGVTAAPEFRLRNFLRDTMQAFVLGRDATMPVLSALGGAREALTRGDFYWEIAAAGGTFSSGYINAHDPQSASRMVRAEMRRKDFADTVIDSPRKLWDSWERFGDAMENANRLAIAKRKLEKTGSYLSAAYEAKDFMDFSLRGDGNIFRFFAETVPFLNARIQGLYRLGRGFAENPVAFTMKGLPIMMAGLVLYMINKDDKRYDELEEWDKDLYWHFWVGDSHVRLPKPFEVGVIFGTIPERILATMYGGADDTTQKLLDRTLWNMWQVFNFNPVPQAATPIIEEVANRQFFTGRPIEGLGLQNLLPSARYTHYTHETSIAAVEAMGPLADQLGISPARVDHILRAYFGTMADYALFASDMIIRHLWDYPAPPTRRLDEMPIAKAFVREEPAHSTRFANEFYDLFSEMEQIYSTIKRKKEFGETDEALQLLRKHRDELAALPAARRANSRLQKIHKQLRLIHMSREMTPEAKRKRIDELLAQRNRIYREIVEAIRERTR